MRTPPILTNSAVTSGAPISLIRRTRAPGNAFSMPKTMPTFFIGSRLRAYGPGLRLRARHVQQTHQRRASRQIRLGHFLPPRPVVPHAAPDVQAMCDVLGGEEVRHPLVVAKTDVVFAGRQNPFVPPITVEVPRVVQPRQKVRRAEEVTVLVVVTVEERVDVVRAAHGDTASHDIRMPERERQRVIPAEAAAGDAR